MLVAAAFNDNTISTQPGVSSYAYRHILQVPLLLVLFANTVVLIFSRLFLLPPVPIRPP